jgi:D-beta-D-heptose 7-phosphate kinase/D-beta-D-heptose 1-phosphate adenosyltransferase
MKDIINQLKESSLKKVIVIGDLMLDEYIFGSVRRISPEAPVPIVDEQKKEWSLGGAANVALNCKHIGCNVSLIGLTGKNDFANKKLRTMLKENNISLEGIIESSSRSTTSKKRIMAKHHQLLRIDKEDRSPLNKEELSSLLTKLVPCITKNSIIVVSDYAKGVITTQVMKEIITHARNQKCMILVDPKGPNFDKYKGADYIKPNFNEFNEMLIFFELDPNQPFVENARKICKLLSLKGLIVTKGDKGIHFVTSHESVCLPAAQREVFDLTGAGDTVIAFLSLGLLNNLPMRTCLELSNRAAAVAISHIKTYAVSLDELIDKNEEPTEKYYSEWNKLKNELDVLRKEKKRIVFTNGCFDLLHSGHIHCLKEAKKHGDILVVALNTDESTKRLKGNSRPIKPLRERAHVMAAIGVVDFVTSFKEDTPANIIEFLKPDIITKGVDYIGKKITGDDIVKKYGGKTVRIGWKNDHSTTTLVQKI